MCLGLLAGSYLASGFINASPITREPLPTARGRVVVVAPDPGAKPSDAPAVQVEPQVPSDTTLSL